MNPGKIKETVLNKSAHLLKSIDVSADEVTLSAFIVGLWVFLMLPYHHYTLAAVFLCINRFLHLIDTRIENITVKSDKSFYLQSVLNYFFCSGFFFFFSLGYDRHITLTSLILFTFSVAFSARICLKLIIEKRMRMENLPSDIRLGGMLSNLEIFIIMFLICLFPQSYGILGIIFVAQCCISFIGHLIVANKVLKNG